MQPRTTRRAALAWIGLAGGLAAADDATGEIQRLVAKYAHSIDTADAALGGEVWSTTPDVTFIHPRGHEHGWEEIQRNIYGFFGRTFSERKLVPRDVSVRVWDDAAIAEFYWVFDAKLKSGAAIQTKGRESQVYRKFGRRRWALVHVHYSGMPVAAP